MEFEYPEDEEFFVNLLAEGDKEYFYKNYFHLFDFRHPAIKRWEFGKIRNKVLKELLDKYGEECQLRLHPDCSKEKVWEPDHRIPLSSNTLNKNLRGVKRIGSAKVAQQSFGSNHIDNLTLACKKCNHFKLNKLMQISK